MATITNDTITRALNNTVNVNLEKYPLIVKQCVTVVNVGRYAGWCCQTRGKTIVTTAGFAHEMGHATAKLLGIEKELGIMVMDGIGAKSVTNENIFCYGAQRLEAGDTNTAIEEYAADAIQAYTEGWEELPINIKVFITKHWNV